MFRKFNSPVFWCIGLLALVCFSMAVAQENSGRVEGMVLDDSGAGVPGATISASSPGLPRDHETVSDNSGAYFFPALPPGVSALRIRSIEAADIPDARETNKRDALNFATLLVAGQASTPETVIIYIAASGSHVVWISFESFILSFLGRLCHLTYAALQNRFAKGNRGEQWGERSCSRSTCNALRVGEF